MSNASGTVTHVKLAAVSYTPEKFDIEGNARRLEGLFRQAAEAGAQLALAPEGALDGIVAMGVLKGEWPAHRALEAAVTIDSEPIRHFRHLARELGMCLAFGFAERVRDGIYDSAVFIDSRGGLTGKYHKMVFGEGYHESWWFNRIGHQSRAIDTPFGPCGFMICYDRWDPRAARLPLLDGARFLLVPTYGNRGDHHDKHVLARARENGVPLAQANGTGAAVIVSGGEIVAKHFAPVENADAGTVTTATIEVPAARPTDEAARRALEADYLAWRDDRMGTRFAEKRAEYLEQWGGALAQAAGASDRRNA